MLTYKDAVKAAEEGQVMIGLSYLPHKQQVTFFEIRRAGETLAMRYSKGILFSGEHTQGEASEEESVIKTTRFKPFAGKSDLLSMPPELVAYTFFMPDLPHPYGSDRQGYKGHFAGTLASLI